MMRLPEQPSPTAVFRSTKLTNASCLVAVSPVHLTRAVTRGADGRDACESKRRDRTDRRVDRVVIRKVRGVILCVRRREDMPLTSCSPDPERIEVSGSLREYRPTSVAPADRSRGCCSGLGSAQRNRETNEKPGAWPLIVHCSGIRITPAVTRGPSGAALALQAP